MKRNYVFDKKAIVTEGDLKPVFSSFNENFEFVEPEYEPIERSNH